MRYHWIHFGGIRHISENIFSANNGARMDKFDFNGAFYWGHSADSVGDNRGIYRQNLYRNQKRPLYIIKQKINF